LRLDFSQIEIFVPVLVHRSSLFGSESVDCNPHNVRCSTQTRKKVDSNRNMAGEEDGDV